MVLAYPTASPSRRNRPSSWGLPEEGPPPLAGCRLDTAKQEQPSSLPGSAAAAHQCSSTLRMSATAPRETRGSPPIGKYLNASKQVHLQRRYRRCCSGRRSARARDIGSSTELRWNLTAVKLQPVCQLLLLETEQGTEQERNQFVQQIYVLY